MWKGKSHAAPISNTGNNFGHAQVAVMINENGEKRGNEVADQDAMKASIREEFKNIIYSQMINLLARYLRAAGVNVASADSSAR